jgi:hypothetical protein
MPLKGQVLMLLIEVPLENERRYWRLVEIVRGEEVHPEQRNPDGSMLAHVLMTEQQYAQAMKEGFSCRIVTDYSKEPDPREEVSKTNRFEPELRRLREQRENR